MCRLIEWRRYVGSTRNAWKPTCELDGVQTVRRFVALPAGGTSTPNGISQTAFLAINARPYWTQPSFCSSPPMEVRRVAWQSRNQNPSAIEKFNL